MRTALITGGTSGIGRAASIRLLSEGYVVWAIGRSELHATETQSALTESQLANFKFYCGDVRDPSTIQAVINDIVKYSGKLSVLVNAAGTISGGGIEVETLESWESVVQTNLTAMFTVTKATLDLLKKADSANIINISSVCSLRPCASLSYSVSKAGTDMFTKVLAKDLARFNIRVNSINPGVVESNLQLSAGLFKSQSEYVDWSEKMVALHPLGRIGQPNDIAAAISFLVNPESSWITGAILSVDGGRSVA